MRAVPLARWVLPLLAISLLLVGRAAGADTERWYIVEMTGQPAGWLRAGRATEEGLIVTRHELMLRIARGPTSLAITMEGAFAETDDGRPVWMKSVQTMAGTPTVVEFRFGEEALEVTSTAGGGEVRDTRPLPEGEWLTPVAAEKRLKEALAAGLDPIEIRTIDPMTGPEPMLLKRAGFEPATLDLGGREVRVRKCISTSSAAPGVESIEYLDDEGTAVRTQMNMMGTTIVMTAASKAAALAAGQGAFEAPELMVSTFIRPDRPIAGARAARRASYVLRLGEGRLPEIPQTGAQRVERLDESSARIVVAPGDPRAAAADEARDPAYLSPSIMLNAEDPEVRRLVKRATAAAGDDPTARAEAMRRFVYRHIGKKSLGVGFASASEAARRREGDCSEHGALLAAMLRADGIPARVVSGLLYAEQFAGEREIFGYHMWTQALLSVNGEPTWVDLDATMPDGAPFDPTHIALSTSSLRDGELQDAFVALAGLIGKLSIQVESVE